MIGCSPSTDPENNEPEVTQGIDEPEATPGTDEPESSPGIRELELVTLLDNNVNETSGLLFMNERLITHNDSGGASSLYEVDRNTGNIIVEIPIGNAVNRDWEDITSDSEYIYIGDIGNNNGDRRDLRIYKVSISDLGSDASTPVMAQEISYSYADQMQFEPSTYNHDYDAEALISIGDSLYIFTKNWANNQTNIYAIPKIPGSYVTSKIDSLTVNGLITAADYDPVNNRVMLLGYQLGANLIVELTDFGKNNFSDGTVKKFVLKVPPGNSLQTEGIIYAGDEMLISAEQNGETAQVLFRLDLED